MSTLFDRVIYGIPAALAAFTCLRLMPQTVSAP